MDSLPNIQTDQQIAWRAHDEITPSLANPRTAFGAAGYDPEKDKALGELADSIAHYGLIEPIVTSRTGCIIAGERRWRAVGLLIARGTWEADRKIPCIDRDLEGADALALAVIENLQRQDVPPLDEARAFNRLITDFGWTKEVVAQAIGKTLRHVELRLDLVERLVPSVQEALAEGRINLAAARIIAQAPAEDQEAHASATERGEYGYLTAEQIRGRITAGKPPVALAAFKLEEYEARGGTYVGGEGDDRHFADLELYKEMQTEAAQARVKKLRDGKKPYAFVELYNRNEPDAERFGLPKGYQWAGDNETGDDIGVLVEIDVGDWEVDTIRCRKVEEKAKAGAKAEAAPKPDFTKAHIAQANRIKTALVAGHVEKDPGAALRLAIMGLGWCPEVRISAGQLMKDDGGEGRRSGLEILQQDMPGALAREIDRSCLTLRDGMAEKVWRWLCELDDAQAMEILARLVAGQFGTWNDYEPKLGDSPLFCAVADRVLAEAEVDWFDWPDDYLATLGKDRLLEIIHASGCATAAAEMLDGTTQALIGSTAKKLREVVRGLADDGLLAGFIPRELQIGSADQLAQPLPEAATPLERLAEQPAAEPAAEAEAAPTNDVRKAPAKKAAKKAPAAKAAKKAPARKAPAKKPAAKKAAAKKAPAKKGGRS